MEGREEVSLIGGRVSERREVFLKGNEIYAHLAAILIFPIQPLQHVRCSFLPRLGKRSTTSELSRRAKRAAKGRADEDGPDAALDTAPLPQFVGGGR